MDILVYSPSVREGNVELFCSFPVRRSRLAVRLRRLCADRRPRGPENEGMKLTKPAVFSNSAGFAAYPRCSAG
jgi:hypothetical protein